MQSYAILNVISRQLVVRSCQLKFATPRRFAATVLI
jgi:hypothetical protein